MLGGLLPAVTGIGPGKSLADTVQLAQTHYVAGNTRAACSTLIGFVDEVRAQAGKQLTQRQPAPFIDAAGGH